MLSGGSHGSEGKAGWRGFALPTVVITSVIMLAMLATALQLTVSMGAALQTGGYNRIATEAAESGLAMANACLAENDYVATWSNAKPLRPNTDCAGNVQSGLSAYLSNASNLRATFTVGGAVDSGAGRQTVLSTGSLEQLRASTGEVYRTYSQNQFAFLGGAITQHHVVLGYASGGNCAGVYFFTFGSNRVARGVGNNSCGQIGKGDQTDAVTPHTVALPGDVGIATASDGSPLIFAHFLSGGTSTIIVGTDGNAYFAGDNSNGVAGIGSTTPAYVTQFTRVALPAGQRAAYAVTSSSSAYIITEAGHVYATGICVNGELGNGTSGTGCSIATTPVRVTLPTPSASNPSTWPASIYLDGQSRYLIMKDGSVYGWAANGSGQLGLGDTALRTTPTKIAGYGGSTGVKALRVETTGGQTFILGDNGVVKGAGSNNYGFMGRGFVGAGTGCTSGRCTTFEPVQLPSTAIAGSKLIDVRTDSTHAAFLTDKGQVFTTGNNRQGQLGCGTPVNGTACPLTSGTPSPVRFVLPSGVTAVAVYATSSANSAGNDVCADNVFAIGNNGRVYGAGCNLYGQLGNGCNLASTTSCKEINGTPVVMSVINGTTVVATNVVSGRGTTIVRTADGLIYTVGANESGQLGDGTTANSSTPNRHKFINSNQPLTVY